LPVISKLILVKDLKDYNGNKFTFEYIDSVYSSENKLLLEVKLTEGQYFLLFKTNSEKDMNIVVSSYLKGGIDLNKTIDKNELSYFEGNNLQKSIYSIYQSFLSKFGKKQEIENNKNLSLFHSINTDTNFGYSVLQIENNSKDKSLSLSLVYEIRGMKIISHDDSKKLIYNSNELDPNYIHQSSNNELKIKIGAKSIELIIFEWDSFQDDIFINIFPRFNLENNFPFGEKVNKELSLYPKVNINKKIYYHEITFKGGVYFIILNTTNKTYDLNVEFEGLVNLKIEIPKEILTNSMGFSFKLSLNSFSKEVVFLKALKESQFSYKVNFHVKGLDVI